MTYECFLSICRQTCNFNNELLCHLKSNSSNNHLLAIKTLIKCSGKFVMKVCTPIENFLPSYFLKPLLYFKIDFKKIKHLRFTPIQFSALSHVSSKPNEHIENGS